eukprot:scaffold470962_cov50-Prasinocladus_malaysianus.AAC.1
MRSQMSGLASIGSLVVAAAIDMSAPEADEVLGVHNPPEEEAHGGGGDVAVCHGLVVIEGAGHGGALRRGNRLETIQRHLTAHLQYKKESLGLKRHVTL